MAPFDTKIGLKDTTDEDQLVRERLPEVLSRLKKVDPGRYGKVDPGKLTPQDPIYAEVRRSVLRQTKPEMYEKRIEDALSSLRSADTYDTYLNRRLAKVEAAAEEGPIKELSGRSRELMKKLASALATGREQYKDVFDPFARERLAAESASQVQDELQGVNTLLKPQQALLEQVPRLAQDDVEEERRRRADELDALQTLYAKAIQDASGLEDEYEKVVASERRKPASGGGGYAAPSAPPSSEEDGAAALVDAIVSDGGSPVAESPRQKRDLSSIFIKR